MLIAPSSLVLVFPFRMTINLKEFVNNYFISRNEKLKIFLDIARALQICHAGQVAHRDIKLDNVVINNQRQIFLIDFGYSIFIKDSKTFSTRKFCGTPLYMAPEVITKKQHDRKHRFPINYFLRNQ